MMLTAVYAQETKQGTLSVFIFKNGQPMQGSIVTVDGKRIFKSDIDGSLKAPLNVGKHRVEIVGRGVDKQNLGYFKKTIEIKEDRDTQVVATFSLTGAPLVTIDTPVGKMTQPKEDMKKVTGKGRLQGVVLSSENKSPIPGARIFVKGTAVDTRTDSSGHFSVEIPAGATLSMSVVHTAYSAQTINNVQVSNGGKTFKQILLTPASMELDEYVVLAPQVEGSISEIVAEEKNTVAITNIIGSEEMTKKGDGNAAAAVRRLPGITIVDGKNVYVRGLGERYSNIEMNSLPLPSPNPIKRVVPLDIFPSNVIGSIEVQKSATPNIPSSFGGGYINIRTKDDIKEDFIKISLAGMVNNHTGDNAINYEGSTTDQLGYDNGYRAIAQPILDGSQIKVGERTPTFTTRDYSKEELSSLTQMYPNRLFNLKNTKLPAGYGAQIEGAKSFDINEDHHISIYGTYRYDQKHRYVPEEFYGYSFKSDGTQYNEPDQYGNIDQVFSTYEHGGMLNVGYNYMDVFRAKYTKLYTRNAIKNTRVVDGIIGSNYSQLTKYYLNWEERTLNADQVSGDMDYQVFNVVSKFSFGMEKSEASYYQPNNYQYSYITEGDRTFVDNSITNHLSNRIESDDNLWAIYLKNKHIYDGFSPEDSIEYGINIYSKERVSRQNKYYLSKQGDSFVDDRDLTQDIDNIYGNYVLPAYPYDVRPFLVSTLFKAADYFDGYVDETSPYISWFTKPWEGVEIVAGVRYVDLTQKIDQYVEDRDNPDVTQRRNIYKKPEELGINEFFPSVTVKYNYDQKNIFDFAASKTYIMPDLREFTEGEYFHPFDVATIVGNPNLVNTTIYNLDLKYSHYFSALENIRVGLYYKYMKDPIEDIQLPTSSLPIYSFANTDFATLYGIEIDGRKQLDFVHEKLSDFYIAGNFSYNYSEVTLTEEQEATFSSNHRQLQGLSPYVINLTLGYETVQRSVVLLYNKMAERIRKVGVIDVYDYPDQYEIPPDLVDIVWIEKFDNDIEMTVRARNIFNDETVWTEDDKVTRRYKKGSDIGVKFSAKFTSLDDLSGMIPDDLLGYIGL